MLKLGFSKFVEARPKQCILPGTHRSHCECVCVHHDNVKLIIDGTNIPKLTEKLCLVIKNYKDALTQITCNPPSQHLPFIGVWVLHEV